MEAHASTQWPLDGLGRTARFAALSLATVLPCTEATAPTKSIASLENIIVPQLSWMKLLHQAADGRGTGHV
jgi:hypothetical protein